MVGDYQVKVQVTSPEPGEGTATIAVGAVSGSSP